MNDWYHVKSEENPANCCSSRGLLPSELGKHLLWWAGPRWLMSPLKRWPRLELKTENLPELKRVNLGVVKPSTKTSVEWMERFSSYTRLLRSVCYILRFIKRCRKLLLVPKGTISLSELKEANKLCIKLVQNNNKIQWNQLKYFQPFLDADGVLRVGGRLRNANLDYDAKHPIIIPGKSHFAKLLVDHYHRLHLHLEPSALQAVLHAQYWIGAARSLIRKRVFECLRCYKANKLPRPPLMGNLPSFRLQEGIVFQHVGVDFGGPFLIRESRRCKSALSKAYLSLFICMSTKAVHLEVVSTLETESFLAAFDRFIARRGKPIRIYSDCGTNFVGASRKLKEFEKSYSSPSSQDNITDHTARQ
ncbi:uncharacterized protein [Halyomorpha halys]|uniref:uncharacterized protein n=1 Tax=Halyomorpha halys TaxID=286706 RepID=UPI0006D4C784